jgi:hypothetical protein
MTFKEFLEKIDETMTSTSCVANFQRITIPMVQRQYPQEITFGEDPFFKKMRKQSKEGLTFKLV